MKIQSLAVIFIIIVLPISLILTSYTQSHVKTLSLQTSYDSKLSNSTYDALKAFQLNTINSDTSDIANSKLRDIEASVNTFFNSISSNFNLVGYNKNVLKEYVPAVVYTMYDGYYIYSPFINTLSSEEKTMKDETGIIVDRDLSSTSYPEGEKLSGLKPYIHYSCRYKKNSEGIDVVITYSLDNYITIQGKIGTENIYKYGYLLDNVENGGSIYRNINISASENLSEYIDDTSTPYKYRKINGVKYYYDENGNEYGQHWFSFLNGEREYQRDNFKENDDTAILYYREAKEFTDFVREKLPNLNSNNAVDESGNSLANKFGNYNIFGIDTEKSIEDPDSNFNSHRLDVIRYSIEKNLSIAIANYNDYSGVKTNFLMPVLKEDEWDKIINNVSIISFMQGLNIGGKIYNGYSIVTNNKNKETVNEDSIYIVSNDQYYKPTDNTINKDTNNLKGIYNIDFERKSYTNNEGFKKYFFPNKAMGSYSSIVNQTNIEDTDNIYKYIAQKGGNLAIAYFTAIGRERYSMYKTNNDSQTLKENIYIE